MFIINDKLILGIVVLTYITILGPRVGAEDECKEGCSCVCNTLSKVLYENKKYTSFVALLQKYDMVKYIDGTSNGDYTVFALDNTLTAELATIIEWNEDIPFIQKVLNTFILIGKYDLATLKAKVKNGAPLINLNSQECPRRVHKNGALVTNGGTVTDPDIRASNGVAHGLNFVAIPQSDQESVMIKAASDNEGQTSNLLFGLEGTKPGTYKQPLDTFIKDLKERKGITFIAPNEDAFNRIYAGFYFNTTTLTNEIGTRAFTESYCWEDLWNMVGDEQVTDFFGEKHDVKKISDTTLEIEGSKFSKPKPPQEKALNGYNYNEL